MNMCRPQMTILQHQPAGSIFHIFVEDKYFDIPLYDIHVEGEEELGKTVKMLNEIFGKLMRGVKKDYSKKDGVTAQLVIVEDKPDE